MPHSAPFHTVQIQPFFFWWYSCADHHLKNIRCSLSLMLYKFNSSISRTLNLKVDTLSLIEERAGRVNSSHKLKKSNNIGMHRTSLTLNLFLKQHCCVISFA